MTTAAIDMPAPKVAPRLRGPHRRFKRFADQRQRLLARDHRREALLELDQSIEAEPRLPEIIGYRSCARNFISRRRREEQRAIEARHAEILAGIEAELRRENRLTILLAKERELTGHIEELRDARARAESLQEKLEFGLKIEMAQNELEILRIDQLLLAPYRAA